MKLNTSIERWKIPIQGIDFINLNNFCDRNQFEGGVTCISSNFGLQMALLALLVKM